jgi:hypothetical protein
VSKRSSSKKPLFAKSGAKTFVTLGQWRRPGNALAPEGKSLFASFSTEKEVLSTAATYGR